jgi:hypothetical protein
MVSSQTSAGSPQTVLKTTDVFSGNFPTTPYMP